MTLDKLKPHESAKITAVGGSGALRHHLLDMGLTPQTEVTLQKVAPMGDPVQFELRGYELTLRLDEARKIEVGTPYQRTKKPSAGQVRHRPAAHPGMGELRKSKDYHIYEHAKAAAADKKLTFALAGNQNCGKTTLFNQLTGANQHVGNFPGVTVDRKDGTIRSHPEATVTDLPGIYSLSPYSSEEIVTRSFLLDNKPDGIINIVDATNIERNLYLTMQMMELGIPMVLALNMMDEVRANGGTVHVNELEQALGIPVVPISAAKNEGIDELIDHAIHIARYQETPGGIDFCQDSSDKNDPVAAVHRCIHATALMIEPNAKRAGLPVRFAATKLIEKDPLIEKALALSDDNRSAFDQIVSVMEKDSGLDREAALANMRFSFLENLCSTTVVRPHESKEHKRSMAIDRFLTGKYTAIPCFAGIMGLIFIMRMAVRRHDRSGQCLHFVAGCRVIRPADQPRCSLARCRRYRKRRWQRTQLPADHCNAVLFPLDSGGHRLYGACGLYHGPAAPQAGTVRPQLCADAGRLRLLGSGHHGYPHTVQ